MNSIIPQAQTRTLQNIPAEWCAPVMCLPANVGPVWDRIRDSIIERLESYSHQGVVKSDVEAGCRALCSLEVQSKCAWPDDWLREFARAVLTARNSRQNQERITEAQKRAKLERDQINNRTPEEAAELTKLLDSMRTAFAMPFEYELVDVRRARTPASGTGQRA